MNCDQFQQQFQHFLDRRDDSPNSDMQSHADRCASCQHQLQLWQRIETSLVSKADQSHSALQTNTATRMNQSKLILTRFIAAAAVAACLAIAFATQRTNDPIVDSQSLTSIDSRSNDINSTSSDIGPQFDPSIWWDDIRDRNWVRHTLPTVRIVSDGVAPLGRSIQRAATLLTTAPREQPS